MNPAPPTLRAIDAPEASVPARAYRIFRRASARSRTGNEINRIHIALGNYMTPAELRFFDTALATDAAPASPNRVSIARHAAQLRYGKARPREFERRAPLRGLTLCTADSATPDRKTLIIGFARNHNRLMVPTPWLLDCFNRARDAHFVSGDGPRPGTRTRRAGQLAGPPPPGRDADAMMNPRRICDLAPTVPIRPALRPRERASTCSPVADPT